MKMDFKGMVNNIKEKGNKVLKGYNNITNFMTTLDYVKKGENIAIIGHDNIDGDSLGSILAMQEWLHNKFPEKSISTYTNKKPSSIFDFIESDIKYGEDTKIDENTDVIIVCDSANLGRLGKLYDNNKELFDKTPIINIDHHISNNEFGAINIVSNVPANAQLVYEMLSLFDVKLAKLVGKNAFNEKVATYLLMGILTDTKNFTIAHTTSKTLKIASDLLERGADKETLILNLFQSKKIEDIKVQALVIDRITKIENDEIISYYSYYSYKDLEKLGLNPEDEGYKEGLLDSLLSIKDADFISLWRIKDKETSVSFRSKGEFDVNILANRLGGGGHKNAAGVKIDKKVNQKEIEKIIIENINIENNDEEKKKTDD